MVGALIPRWSGHRPEWVPPEFYWVFGCSYTGLPEHLAPVRYQWEPTWPCTNARSRRSAASARNGKEAIRVPFVRGGWCGRRETSPMTPISRFASSSAGQIRSGSISRRPGCSTRLPRSALRSLSCPSPQLRGGLGQSCARRVRGVGGRELGSERRYLRCVLPHGIADGLRQLAHGEPPGPHQGRRMGHRRDCRAPRGPCSQASIAPSNGGRSGHEGIGAPTAGARRRPMGSQCEWTTSRSARRFRLSQPRTPGPSFPTAPRCALSASTAGPPA